MKADDHFLGQPKEFWANIRTISQAVGYTRRAKKGSGTILVPTLEEIRERFELLNLSMTHIFSSEGALTPFGDLLFFYFRHRADVLNDVVSKLLMNRDQAKAEFDRLHEELAPKCPIPLNKQRAKNEAPHFLPES